MIGLYFGPEETNIVEFMSPCCGACLSIEPLSFMVCSDCGKPVKHDEAIRRSDVAKHGAWLPSRRSK